MRVDRFFMRCKWIQPFSINTIEHASKKVLVRPKMTDKGKDIVIGDHRTSKYCKEGLLGRLRKRRPTSPEAGEAQLSMCVESVRVLDFLQNLLSKSRINSRNQLVTCPETMPDFPAATMHSKRI